DGIRDFHVTGVQTCALPILDLTALATPIYSIYNLVGHQLANRSFFFFGEQITYTVQELPVTLVGEFIPDSTALGDFIGNANFGRSEERRVGKECRYRW